MAKRSRNPRIQLVEWMRAIKETMTIETRFWEWYGRTTDNRYHRTLPGDFPENHAAHWRTTAARLDDIAFNASLMATWCREQAAKASI